MQFILTGDTSAESGLDSIFDWSGPIRQYFLSKHYGNGLLGIGVVLMCQAPSLNLKRRVRFAKREKILYLDIMLDLNQMKRASSEEKKTSVLERLGSEIPQLLRRYDLTDFDEARFSDDLQTWLKGLM